MRGAGHAGAVSTGGGPRARWGDEPARGPAGGAAAAVSERRVVTGIADRPLRPPCGWWPVRAAVRTDRGGPLSAANADRFRPGCERTRPASLAAAADSSGHLIAAIADVRDSIVGAAGDPPGPSALPADALRSIGAPSTERPTLGVATGDRFHHPTFGAGHRELPSPAAGADPTRRGPGQRLAGATAPGADRVGQVRAAAP
jgi:hypothetical protein